jgi:hypothetical protein
MRPIFSSKAVTGIRLRRYPLSQFTAALAPSIEPTTYMRVQPLAVLQTLSNLFDKCQIEVPVEIISHNWLQPSVPAFGLLRQVGSPITVDVI